MKKNSTKSLLACAVLASVLAGGMVPVQAADVNAVVGPNNVNGKTIIFGQKQGYAENGVAENGVAVSGLFDNHSPKWTVVNFTDGNLTLLADEAWGITEYSASGNFFSDHIIISLEIGLLLWK